MTNPEGSDLPSNIIDIFSKPKVSSTIQVRERNDIVVVYTYCIRYLVPQDDLGSEERDDWDEDASDTLIIDTNTFSYEEAVYAATQLIEMGYAEDKLGRFKDCKVLDIELMEVHIHYE